MSSEVSLSCGLEYTSTVWDLSECLRNARKARYLLSVNLMSFYLCILIKSYDTTRTGRNSLQFYCLMNNYFISNSL